MNSLNIIKTSLESILLKVLERDYLSFVKNLEINFMNIIVKSFSLWKTFSITFGKQWYKTTSPFKKFFRKYFSIIITHWHVVKPEINSKGSKFISILIEEMSNYFTVTRLNS